jgi:hypothetical protein
MMSGRVTAWLLANPHPCPQSDDPSRSKQRRWSEAARREFRDCRVLVEIFDILECGEFSDREPAAAIARALGVEIYGSVDDCLGDVWTVQLPDGAGFLGIRSFNERPSLEEEAFWEDYDDQADFPDGL